MGLRLQPCFIALGEEVRFYDSNFYSKLIIYVHCCNYVIDFFPQCLQKQTMMPNQVECFLEIYKTREDLVFVLVDVFLNEGVEGT